MIGYFLPSMIEVNNNSKFSIKRLNTSLYIMYLLVVTKKKKKNSSNVDTAV